MADIAAAWRYSSQAEPATSDLVDTMLATLRPSGPYEARRWNQGPVALGVNPSNTLPEDVFDRDPELADGFVLAADLRLDNRDELRRTLDVEESDARTISDSGWLRLAWRRWGADCVDHLLGEFAFALWDAGNRQLICAVDPMAHRPLFHAEAQRVLAVASMPSALLALPGVSRQIDREVLASVITYRPPAAGRTVFSSIAQIPAGHILRATERGVEVRPYHRMARKAIRYRRDEEYVEHFSEVFEAAVRARLRSAGGVGSLLSGGLDSSAVTTVAADILATNGQSLTAVTWRPRPGSEIPTAYGRITDESHGAAAVAALHPNVRHMFAEGDHARLVPLMNAATRCGEAITHPMKYPLYEETAARLREHGCKVLLIGRGGNSTISFDGRLLLGALFREGRGRQMVAELRALAAGGHRVRGMVFDAIAPSLPGGMTRWITGRIRGNHGDLLRRLSAIHPAFAARFNIASLGSSPVWSRTDSWAVRMAHIAAAQRSINRKVMEPVVGLELRDPTMDLRVVEFCLSIPDDQHLRSGQMRWLIRRAMRGKLPPETLDGARRGLQNSDWPRFLNALRPDLVRLVHRFRLSPLLSEALDLDALDRLLREWPLAWTDRHRSSYGLKLLRAVAAGLFVLQCGSGAERGPDAGH